MSDFFRLNLRFSLDNPDQMRAYEILQAQDNQSGYIRKAILYYASATPEQLAAHQVTPTPAVSDILNAVSEAIRQNLSATQTGQEHLAEDIVDAVVERLSKSADEQLKQMQAMYLQQSEQIKEFIELQGKAQNLVMKELRKMLEDKDNGQSQETPSISVPPFNP